MTDAVVTTRNARFQQWQSYLTTRAKRTKAGVFFVHGVRPITLALDHHWPLDCVLYCQDGPALSQWAQSTVDRIRASGVPAVAVAADLMAELGDRQGGAPELLVLATSRLADHRTWSPSEPNPVVVVCDRPSSPGNLGTLIRSADAFGASAVAITGHGADPFDPVCVRATTGSLFSVPVLQVGGPEQVLDMVHRLAFDADALTVVGTDETGAVPLFGHDFTRGTVLVVGNETRGMSAAWRDACDAVVSIPIGGAASSLGAPSAGAVALYEIARQRSH